MWSFTGADTASEEVRRSGSLHRSPDFCLNPCLHRQAKRDYPRSPDSIYHVLIYRPLRHIGCHTLNSASLKLDFLVRRSQNSTSIMYTTGYGCPRGFGCPRPDERHRDQRGVDQCLHRSPYQCSVCSKSSRRKDSVENHRLSHYEAALQCSNCKLFYQTKHNFQKHLKSIRHEECRRVGAIVIEPNKLEPDTTVVKPVAFVSTDNQALRRRLVVLNNRRNAGAKGGYQTQQHSLQSATYDSLADVVALARPETRSSMTYINLTSVLDPLYTLKCLHALARTLQLWWVTVFDSITQRKPKLDDMSTVNLEILTGKDTWLDRARQMACFIQPLLIQTYDRLRTEMRQASAGLSLVLPDSSFMGCPGNISQFRHIRMLGRNRSIPWKDHASASRHKGCPFYTPS